MKTNEPLKLGFIGGSVHSAVGYAHFCASRLDNRWILVAGCFSTNHVRNTETAKTYSIAPGQVYNSWQELINSESNQLDAISVITPTPEHFQIVQACLLKGIPVICEKALGTSSKEVEELVAVKNRVNGFLGVTYNYSFYPMIREMRKKIANEELGKILHFHVTMPQEGYLRERKHDKKVQAWRLQDHNIPTIHMDLAVHMHQLVHFLIRSKPLAVVSQQNSFGAFDVIDDVTALCKYEGSVSGLYWFSKASLGHRNGLCIKVYGSKGSAIWEQAKPEQLTMAYTDGTIKLIDRSSDVLVAGERKFNRFKPGHPAGFIEAFANLYFEFSEGILQFKETGTWESSSHLGPELAGEGLQFLEAMALSANTNNWEPVNNNN
jgi:predicted dehydrogenase